jgi:hypothetical protein
VHGERSGRQNKTCGSCRKAGAACRFGSTQKSPCTGGFFNVRFGCRSDQPSGISKFLSVRFG